MLKLGKITNVFLITKDLRKQNNKIGLFLPKLCVRSGDKNMYTIKTRFNITLTIIYIFTVAAVSGVYIYSCHYNESPCTFNNI